MKFEGEAELAPCPSAEKLAAWIDRTGLSLAERNRVTAHLARCSACVEVVAATVETAAAIKEGSWRG